MAGGISVGIRETSHHNSVGVSLLDELTSATVLTGAHAWLCGRRRDYPAHSDIWWFRSRWQAERTRIASELRSGSYRFSLLTRIRDKDGGVIDLWPARDALVLKALAVVLAKHLPQSQRCTHLQRPGGHEGRSARPPKARAAPPPSARRSSAARRRTRPRSGAARGARLAQRADHRGARRRLQKRRRHPWRQRTVAASPQVTGVCVCVIRITKP